MNQPHYKKAHSGQEIEKSKTKPVGKSGRRRRRRRRRRRKRRRKWRRKEKKDNDL